MKKGTAFVLLGLVLLAASIRTQSRSARLFDEATGLIPTREDLPDGDIDWFDQVDPRTLASDPKSLAMIREGRWIQNLTFLLWFAGPSLISYGVLKLITPSPLRKELNVTASKNEEPPCSSAEQ